MVDTKEEMKDFLNSRWAEATNEEAMLFCVRVTMKEFYPDHPWNSLSEVEQEQMLGTCLRGNPDDALEYEDVVCVREAVELTSAKVSDLMLGDNKKM